MGVIWVFDSGLWGIQTLKMLKKQFPHYDYMYIADTAHAPYGTEEISLSASAGSKTDKKSSNGKRYLDDWKNQ